VRHSGAAILAALDDVVNRTFDAVLCGNGAVPAVVDNMASPHNGELNGTNPADDLVAWTKPCIPSHVLMPGSRSDLVAWTKPCIPSHVLMPGSRSEVAVLDHPTSVTVFELTRKINNFILSLDVFLFLFLFLFVYFSFRCVNHTVYISPSL
jgi:hypothetical protein